MNAEQSRYGFVIISNNSLDLHWPIEHTIKLCQLLVTLINLNN